MAKDHKNELFEIGRDAMLRTIEALETGRPLTRREVVLPDPPADVTPQEITHLRTDTFKVSQHVFAKLLNVSARTVQGWEQGRSRPTGATLRLLRIAQDNPQILLRSVRGVARRKPASARSDHSVVTR